MYYVSFFRYPLSFLCANELRDENFYCTASQILYLPTSAAPTPYVCTGITDTNCLGVCSYTRGSQILDQFNMASDPAGRSLNLGILFIFAAGFQFLSFLAIRFINHVKR
jgi:hypothetical protein